MCPRCTCKYIALDDSTSSRNDTADARKHNSKKYQTITDIERSESHRSTEANAKQLSRIPDKSRSSGERPEKWAGEQSNQYDSQGSKNEINCNNRHGDVVMRGHIQSPNSSSGSSMTTEYTSSTYSLGKGRSIASEDDESSRSSTTCMKADEEEVEERG